MLFNRYPLIKIENKLRLINKRPLFQNTLWMVGGLGARTLIQACYFILIARSLGPSEYGAFIATTALIGIMAPFASWGAGNILVKHVARDAATFPVYWGAA